MNRLLLTALLLPSLTLGAARLTAADAKTDTPRATYEIPRLESITLDGDGEDWRDAGFVVNLFVPRRGTMPEPANFTPRVKLGWDDKGLLLLATVKDDKPIEIPGKDQSWSADSIEIFLAPDWETAENIQYIINPGADPTAGKPEAQIMDRGVGRTEPLEPEFAGRPLPDGYVIEARIPWGAISLKAAAGAKFGINIQVNDRDALEGGSRFETTWYPLDFAGKGAKHMQHVTLAAKAGKPQQTNANFGVMPTALGMEANVVALKELAGKEIVAKSGEKTLATGKLAESGATSSLRLAIPIAAPILKPEETVTVSLGKEVITSFTLKALAQRRVEEISSLDMKLRPIFSGAAFPKPAFTYPGWAETLIGPFKMEAAYYDADYNLVTKPEKSGRYGMVTTITAEGVAPMYRYVSLYRAPEEVQWRTWGEVKVDLPIGLGVAAGSPTSQREISKLARGLLAYDLEQEIWSAGDIAALVEMAEAKENYTTDAVDAKWWFGLKKKLGHIQHRYLTDLPEGYDKDPAKKWPLIVFLHGAGERGVNVEDVRNNGLAREVGAGRKVPAVVISPQCNPRDWWDATGVVDLVDEICKKYRIDEDRITLTGLSMGGYGTWATASSYPERFAAIAPICGGGDPDLAANIVKVPTWAFHGDADKLVPLYRSTEMTEAMEKAGGKPKLTVYPGVAHNSWDPAYADKRLVEWLLANSKSNPIPPPAE